MSRFQRRLRNTFRGASIAIHLWQSAGVGFFAYLILVVLWRGPRGRRGRLAAGAAAIGLLLVGATIYLPLARQDFLLDWIWPPVILLIAYWAGGLTFVAPIVAQERALMRSDERLRIFDLARRVPQPIVELLEAAYVGVYPLIPIALILHLALSPHPDASRFWSVVLLTDFVCFAFLPWVQTRPPRALEPRDPWSSAIRRFNLRLLGATSIQVNTFPSGHAAEGLAAALLLLDAPPAVVAAMFTAALAVSAGAVLGRYHYAVDAFAGWAVAVAVFVLVR